MVWQGTQRSSQWVVVCLHFILLIQLWDWLEAPAGSSTEKLAAASGRRRWPICWCCLDSGTGSFDVEDATTLSWSSAAVSEWVSHLYRNTLVFSISRCKMWNLGICCFLCWRRYCRSRCSDKTCWSRDSDERTRRTTEGNPCWKYYHQFIIHETAEVLLLLNIIVA